MAATMTATRRTKYQQTHNPQSKTEILCASRKPLKCYGAGSDGFCPDCNRYLKRGGRDHKPERPGVFGWIERYADNSTRVINGERNMPWCKVCERSDVPAIHRTPIIGEPCFGPVFPSPGGGA